MLSANVLLGGLSDSIVSSLLVVNLPDPAEGRYLQNKLIYVRETFWTAEIREATWQTDSTLCKEKWKWGRRRICLKKAKNC